jgi:hypothetical protein
VLKKKNFQRIIEPFTQTIVTKLSKIWLWDPGSGKNLFRIPDPGVKKAPDPGSATLVSRTEGLGFLLEAWKFSLEAIQDNVFGHQKPGSGLNPDPELDPSLGPDSTTTVLFRNMIVASAFPLFPFFCMDSCVMCICLLSLCLSWCQQFIVASMDLDP